VNAGGRNGGGEKKPTAADLDADLDNYHGANKASAAAPAAAAAAAPAAAAAAGQPAAAPAAKA
jgi:hypothetical protein